MMRDVTNLADKVLPGASQRGGKDAEEASQPPLRAQLAEAWQGKVLSCGYRTLVR